MGSGERKMEMGGGEELEIFNKYNNKYEEIIFKTLFKLYFKSSHILQNF